MCREFATLGYCKKGASCTERHVHECPAYANSGVCRSQKCQLPHVDRAGQIRQHATNAADHMKVKSVTAENDGESDLSSDEGDFDEIDSDDVDSEGLEEEDVITQADNSVNHALSQQQDFVHF